MLTKLLTLCCLIALAGPVVMTLTGNVNLVGPLVISFFVILALAVRSSAVLKGFSFTILIFAAVVTALYYPGFFTRLGGFELKKLIIPLLMIIMFGMGTAMSFRDFTGIIKMPKGVLIGILCQFTIMPFIGLGLAYVSGLPAEIAAGIILVGCSPSGRHSHHHYRRG